MKKVLLLLFSFLFMLFYSQQSNYTITYKVTFKPQKENLQQKIEYMNLHVSEGKSYFYNADLAKIDSLVSINDSSLDDDQELPFLKFEVFQDLPKNNMIFSSNFNQIKYSFKEKNVVWKPIDTIPFRLGNYNIKEVSTNYGNRDWTILYTPDVPIFNGPYVFSGLPGLVYKAQSNDLEYVFELVGIKKNTIKVLDFPIINTTKNKYIKGLDDFLKNPGNYHVIYKNIWGDTFQYTNKIKSPDQILKQEKDIKKIVDKFNNPIDRNLFLINF